MELSVTKENRSGACDGEEICSCTGLKILNRIAVAMSSLAYKA